MPPPSTTAVLSEHAEELFHAAKVAQDALLDKDKRAELDAKLAARAAHAARYAAMDSARAKMRDDLEAREARARAGVAAAAAPTAAAKAAADARKELERLRQQGVDRARELAEQLAAQRSVAVPTAAARASQAAPAGSDDAGGLRMDTAVRARWPADLHLPPGGGQPAAEPLPAGTLTDGQLRSMFESFGRIHAIIGRKPQAACIVFDSRRAAEAAAGAPPHGFRVALVTEPDDTPAQTSTTAARVVAGRSQADADGQFPTVVGAKRRRYDSDDGSDATGPMLHRTSEPDCGGRQHEPRPASSAAVLGAAAPPSGGLDLASKEAATLARLKALAEKRKAGAAAAASAGTAPGAAKVAE